MKLCGTVLRTVLTIWVQVEFRPYNTKKHRSFYNTISFLKKHEANQQSLIQTKGRQQRNEQHFLRQSKKNFHDYIHQRKQISLIELIIIILGGVKVYAIKVIRTVDHNNPKYT